MEKIVTRKYTIGEYHRMAKVGIIGPEGRVKLINGEVTELSPIGK